MVVVAVGVNLVTGVDVEHGVQTLGGAGILFKLLHLAERYTETEEETMKERGQGQAGSREGERGGLQSVHFFTTGTLYHSSSLEHILIHN